MYGGLAGFIRHGLTFVVAIFVFLSAMPRYYANACMKPDGEVPVNSEIRNVTRLVTVAY